MKSLPVFASTSDHLPNSQQLVFQRLLQISMKCLQARHTTVTPSIFSLWEQNCSRVMDMGAG